MSEAPFHSSRYARNDLLLWATDYLILRHYHELWHAMTDGQQHLWTSLYIEYVPKLRRFAAIEAQELSKSGAGTKKPSPLL